MQCGRSSRSLLLKRDLIRRRILHQTVTFVGCLPANRKSTDANRRQHQLCVASPARSGRIKVRFSGEKTRVRMASFRNYGTGRCGSGRPRVPSGVSPYDQKRANPGEKRRRKRILDAAMVETFHDRKYSWLRDGNSCLSHFAALLSVTIENRPISVRMQQRVFNSRIAMFSPSVKRPQ